MTQPRTDPTDDQLLGHARRLSLEFSGRAAEFDLARKLGQDASDAMAQAGFIGSSYPSIWEDWKHPL